MATPTDERRDLLTVVATMHAKAGKEDELRAALESLIPTTVSEDGNVNYDLHQGVEDPGQFVFYENWESADHLDTHLTQPHLVDFASVSAELVDDSGLKIMRLRRIG